jgi:type II secretory pathway pseudopilin PulG
MPTTRRTIRGFTLAESLFAVVLVGTVGLALGTALASASKLNSTGRHEVNATQLARALMEEIHARSFERLGNPGWDAGTTSRISYDDVFDYNGYADTSPFSGLKANGPTFRPGGGTFTRRVAVTPLLTPTSATLPGMPTVTASTARFARIDIRVTAPDRTVHTLSRIVGRSTLTR